MCKKKRGLETLFLSTVNNIQPIRMLEWINIPTVLILNIDCLVLMGSIVNFNKINFILLFHRFIIILHGTLGMPLFYIIRCHNCHLVIAAFSFASLFNCPIDLLSPLSNQQQNTIIQCLLNILLKYVVQKVKFKQFIISITHETLIQNIDRTGKEIELEDEFQNIFQNKCLCGDMGGQHKERKGYVWDTLNLRDLWNIRSV